MAEDATSMNFLQGLRDDTNREAWARFAQRYADRLRAWACRWCCRWGLRAQDAQETAEELAQDLLANIHDRMATYDVTQWTPGGFRRWLRTVTHNALVDYLERRSRDRGSGASAVMQQLAEQPAREDLEQEQEREFQLEVERRALVKVKSTVTDRDWQIVEALGFADGRAARWQGNDQGPPSVAAVAASFAMSPSAVLVVKNRVKRKLRAEKARLLQEGNSG